jgi:transcriptional pleiotropic regulator of transition state genes
MIATHLKFLSEKNFFFVSLPYIDIFSTVVYNIYVKQAKPIFLFNIRNLMREFLTKRRDRVMKSTGMVRKIDNLGRIVLPIELRRVLEIDQDSSLQIFVEGEDIILKKYQPACIFCGEAKGVTQYKGRNICNECRKEIGEL